MFFRPELDSTALLQDPEFISLVLSELPGVNCIDVRIDTLVKRYAHVRLFLGSHLLSRWHRFLWCHFLCCLRRLGCKCFGVYCMEYQDFICTDTCLADVCHSIAACRCISFILFVL